MDPPAALILATIEDASSGDNVWVVGGRVAGLEGMRVTVTVTLSGPVLVAVGAEGALVVKIGRTVKGEGLVVSESVIVGVG